MSIADRKLFEVILEHLALDKAIKQIKELDVPADLLAWHRFFGALLLVLPFGSSSTI